MNAEMIVCKCGNLRAEVPGCLACGAYDRVEPRQPPLGSGEFATLLLRAGRAHGPALLWMAFDHGIIDAVTVTAHVGEVWRSAEYPDRALDWDDWVALFEAAGYTEEGKPAQRPREALTLYRAAGPGHQCGHTWTHDVEIAEIFLHVGGRDLFDSQVWVANVEPWRLLAAIELEGPGEAQYVVETLRLDVSAHTMHTQAPKDREEANVKSPASQ